MSNQIEQAKADYHYWQRKYDLKPSAYHRGNMQQMKTRYERLVGEWERRRNNS